MTRKKSAAPCRVLDPVRGCQFCKGTGWVRGLVSPAMERVGGGRVEYSAPMERCSCTRPEVRQNEAPQPAPAELDGARKRSGEKSID